MIAGAMTPGSGQHQLMTCVIRLGRERRLQGGKPDLLPRPGLKRQNLRKEEVQQAPAFKTITSITDKEDASK